MNATTTLVGLMGWPVSHSVSPAMHNAAFAERGLEWCYVPLPVSPEPVQRVGEAVRGLRALDFRGANVTVPHKQAAMEHLDSLTPAARAIGAVNTIIVEPNGRIVGDNTDADGFAADLRAQGVNPSGVDALVLGAGGSARAIVYALAQAGASRVVVANRTAERAQRLSESLQPLFANCLIDALAAEGAMKDAASESGIVVNCTTQGMMPNLDSTPWPMVVTLRPGQVVYDLVYNPRETRFLRDAAAQGARTIGGLGMLVQQAALAFERWTGLDAPVETMRNAALAHFAARGQTV